MKIAKIPKLECSSPADCQPVKPKKPASSTSPTVNWSSHRVRHKSGPESYADLITRALKSSLERKMSLAEIYDWLATNVPGLQEQRYLHSSKGWKNAVRHTLSINPRFEKEARVGRPGYWRLATHAVQKSRTSPNSPTTPQRLVPYIHECLELELEEFRPRRGTEPAYCLSSSYSKRSTNGFIKSPLLASPLSSESAFEFDFSGRQCIKVVQDDGTVKLVTIPKPVHMKSKVTEDVGTQTEYVPETIKSEPLFDAYELPKFDPDLPSLNLDHFHSNNFDHLLISSWTRNASSKETTQNLLLNLPDDLQGITLDPTLNCDFLKIWSEMDWLTN